MKNPRATLYSGCLGLFTVLHGPSAFSQDANKRCYTVDETMYKFKKAQAIPYIEPTRHCYSERDHPYRYSVLDISISFAKGEVQTPEFFTKTHWYWILIQVEKPLPTEQISCMMAVESDAPQSWKECPVTNRLLRADWTVLEDGKATRSGSSTTHADGKWTTDLVFKFLGDFPAISGHRYSVQVRLTQDGTPLDIANPHLIVVKQGEE